MARATERCPGCDEWRYTDGKCGTPGCEGKAVTVAMAREPTDDKRNVIRDCINANPHSPVTADAILNALHQAGWKVVPRTPADGW